MCLCACVGVCLCVRACLCVCRCACLCVCRCACVRACMHSTVRIVNRADKRSLILFVIVSDKLYAMMSPLLRENTSEDVY